MCQGSTLFLGESVSPEAMKRLVATRPSMRNKAARCKILRQDISLASLWNSLKAHGDPTLPSVSPCAWCSNC